MSKSTISTFELFQMFPDAEAARVYMEGKRWPDGSLPCPVRQVHMNLYLIPDDEYELLVWARTPESAMEIWRGYFNLEKSDMEQHTQIFLVPLAVPDHPKPLAWHNDILKVNPQ